MPVVVQKFGGTSVDGPDRIKSVAARLVETRRSGVDVIAVVSAMGQTTDEMIRLAEAVNPSPPQRELDMLVTAGERVTMALTAMAIDALGERAISFTGSQSGIITSSDHGNARIVDVRPFRIQEALSQGRIVIVAGYQGVSTEKEITTLGRGGSDLTAVALAGAFRAERCELYKDVPGVMTADPRLCPEAVTLPRVSLPAMAALARAGASVLYEEAALFAAEQRITIDVRSSFEKGGGTRIELEDTDPEAMYAVSLHTDGGPGVVVSLIGTPRAVDRVAAQPPRSAVRQRAEPYRVVWACSTREEGLSLLRTVHRDVLLPTLGSRNAERR